MSKRVLYYRRVGIDLKKGSKQVIIFQRYWQRGGCPTRGETIVRAVSIR